MNKSVMENNLNIPPNLTTELLYDPSFLLLDIYPKDFKTQKHFHVLPCLLQHVSQYLNMNSP